VNGLNDRRVLLDGCPFGSGGWASERCHGGDAVAEELAAEAVGSPGTRVVGVAPTVERDGLDASSQVSDSTRSTTVSVPDSTVSRVSVLT